PAHGALHRAGAASVQKLLALVANAAGTAQGQPARHQAAQRVGTHTPRKNLREVPRSPSQIKTTSIASAESARAIAEASRHYKNAPSPDPSLQNDSDLPQGPATGLVLG